ncbi:MAG: hypothetical protein MZV65_13910 [Chromatiales bacterium]|nr:hypothetical protein [Chromatiales bacterium]
MAMGIKPMLSGVLDAEDHRVASRSPSMPRAPTCTAPGVRRRIRKALELGATQEEITAVLQLTSVLGIHTMSLGAPILLEELAAAKRAPARRPAAGRSCLHR